MFLDKHPDASVAALTLRNNPRRRSRFARRNSITSGGSGYRPNRSRRNPMIQSWSGYPPIRANRKKARRNGKARRNTLRRNVGLGGGFESLRKGATDFFKGKNLGAFTVNALVAGTGFGLANFTTNWLLTTVPREGGELRKLVIDQSPWIRFGTFLFKGLVAFSIAAAAKSVKSVGVANQMTNLATGAAVSAGRDALFTISSFFPDEGRLRFQQMLLAGPLSLGEGDNQYINAPGLRSSAFAVAPNANRYASASGWNQYAQAPALGMGGYGQVSGYGQVGAYGEVGDYGTNALEAYGEALPDYSAVGGFGNSNSLKM
ncbi:MAG: hypothetical protein Q8O94_02750 [bacterium]|nr:hypothetical protein [bacterium]